MVVSQKMPPSTMNVVSASSVKVMSRQVCGRSFSTTVSRTSSCGRGSAQRMMVKLQLSEWRLVSVQ